MESHPDSSLSLLYNIDTMKLSTELEKARYALLMSMALDKNYIDMTSFKVLQPAIDYYLNNGSSTEKLRTLYYQGRIYQNKNDREEALSTLAKCIGFAARSTDSLTVARAYVAQGYLFKDFYDFQSYMNNFLKAAHIYNDLSKKTLERDCILKALNGAILLKNKVMCDSLMNICNTFNITDDIELQNLDGYRLSYVAVFGSKNKLDEYIENRRYNTRFDVNGMLNLALAYNKVDKFDDARKILDSLQNNTYDTLKFMAISVDTYEGLGKFKEALHSYKYLSHKLDSINSFIFEQKAKSLNEKHSLELKAQKEANAKSKILWCSSLAVIVLLFLVIVLLLINHNHKVKKDLVLQQAKLIELDNNRLKVEKDLAYQKSKVIQVENENLRTEGERLSLENKNLQLERDKKALEAENLCHRVEMLENESYSLKKLLDSSDEIPSEVKKAIRIRIEMLNALLAGYITDNDQYEKPYDLWVREITENTSEFMNSNRLAFQASHPQFIRYFEEHGLSIDEINYVCLYAIGLRGKEVGNYIKKRSHVNTSSAIRKKLGIDKHETNIGIYVRRLLKTL
ncbi:MAG: hypothetical protein K2M55_03940 [Muribaculaceae bacterium]|nr:hypothetical protein [Muribaculaceae bacterium]